MVRDWATPPFGARALVVLVAALFPLAVRGREARADDSASAPSGTVALRIVGPDDPALRDSIRELLSRLHLALAMPRTDDAGAGVPLVARVEIDLSAPTDAVLVVTDQTGDLRVRRTVPREASAAIVREEIAHAIQSEVESALLAARERATRPPTPPPTSPAPAPASSAPEATRLAPPLAVAQPPPSLSPKEQANASAHRPPVGLEITTLAGAGPVANGAGPGTRIGLSTAVVSRWPLHPTLAISGLYAVPFDSGPVGAVALSAHTNVVAIRLLPSIEIIHTKWLAIDVGVGGGLDVMIVSPRIAESPFLVTDSGHETTREDPILSAMISARFALASSVSFLVSAGIDVDPVARQYVLAEGTSNVSVFTPWQERPMFLAGLGFDALGDVRFGEGR